MIFPFQDTSLCVCHSSDDHINTEGYLPVIFMG